MATDRSAIGAYVASVERYVAHQARRYRMGSGLARDVEDDLRAVGRVGAWRAAQAFDPGRGVKFLTYASDRIRQAMARWIDAHGHVVKYPVRKSRGRPRDVSLDAPFRVAGREDDGARFTGLMRLESGDSGPDEGIELRERQDRLRAAIGTLKRRQRAVALGLLSGRTCPEIALQLGITASAVYEIQRHVILELRRRLST